MPLVGRKTYDYIVKLMGPAHYDHGEKDVYVISRTARAKSGRTTFTDDVVELVKRLNSENGQGIYCDGGAEIINELLKHNLVDELTISVIPILLN